jgi:hypothetical protein
VLALILANGFFSGAEMAIVASRRGRLRMLAEQGDAKAKAALDLASSPDTFLPTVQVGITLVGTLAAAYGGDRLVGHMAAWIAAHAPPAIAAAATGIALSVFVALLSFFTLLFGELVPKRLALRHAEACARLAAPVMQWFSRLVRPLVWGMSTATSAVLFLLGQRKPEGPSVSVDDIEHLLEAGRAELDNAYSRVVTERGNEAAQAVLTEVFEPVDRAWRGIGTIPASGWRLARGYREFDAEERFAVAEIHAAESPLCRSGEVLKGTLKPNQCPAFGKECTPRTPLGATMVSSEGACAAYYHFGRFAAPAAGAAAFPQDSPRP